MTLNSRRRRRSSWPIGGRRAETRWPRSELRGSAASAEEAAQEAANAAVEAVERARSAASRARTAAAEAAKAATVALETAEGDKVRAHIDVEAAEEAESDARDRFHDKVEESAREREGRS
jgi:hypothetical protein